MEPTSLVLLGCRVAGPSALSPPARRRADRALLAWQNGEAQRILICGGKAWSGVREADAISRYLIECGLPEHALERELWSRSTLQNAHFAAKLWAPRGLLRVGVVTCDWHMPRALSCFRRAGFEAAAVPARSPQVSPFAATWRAAKEHVSSVLDQLVPLGLSST